MGTCTILAEALRYPAPGRLEALRSSARQIEDAAVRQHFDAFLQGIQKLTLGQWEEVHTSTLDLSPAVAPYIGFQTWGESYQRGAFMSSLNRAIDENQIDLDGELPDHLAPVLRYLDVVQAPLPELNEVLPPAVHKMLALLRKNDNHNSYVPLLEAIECALDRSR